MPIDWNKPVRTRDGDLVKIWTTNAKCDPIYPVHGECFLRGDWEGHTWMADGRYIDGAKAPAYMDLMNVPEELKYERFILVHKDAKDTFICKTLETAKESRMRLERPKDWTILKIGMNFTPGVDQLGGDECN